MGIVRGRISERRLPPEFRRGASRATAVRASVAAQLATSVVESDMTGSREYLSRRLRSYVEAERAGDATLVRASLMELIDATAGYVCQLDLTSVSSAAYTPPEGSLEEQVAGLLQTAFAETELDDDGEDE